MTTNREKVALLAWIVRIVIRRTTEADISEELSLPLEQSSAYVRSLKAKGLITLADGRGHFPNAPGAGLPCHLRRSVGADGPGRPPGIPVRNGSSECERHFLEQDRARREGARNHRPTATMRSDGAAQSESLDFSPHLFEGLFPCLQYPPEECPEQKEESCYDRPDRDERQKRRENLPQRSDGLETARRPLPRRHETSEIERVRLAPPFHGVHGCGTCCLHGGYQGHGIGGADPERSGDLSPPFLPSNFFLPTPAPAIPLRNGECFKQHMGPRQRHPGAWTFSWKTHCRGA